MCDEEFREGDHVMFEHCGGRVIRGLILDVSDDGTYIVKDEDTMELYARISGDALFLARDGMDGYKVGDVVEHCWHGRGVITEVGESPISPVWIRFDNGYYGNYSQKSIRKIEEKEELTATFKKFDEKAINPSYYKDGKYECFDVAVARIREMELPGMEAAMFFNVFKYLWRYKVKHADNPREDLEKAAWYLQKLIVCVTDKAKA